MLKITIRELAFDTTRAYALPSISTVETADNAWILTLSVSLVIDSTTGSAGFVIFRIVMLCVFSDVITAYVLFCI